MQTEELMTREFELLNSVIIFDSLANGKLIFKRRHHRVLFPHHTCDFKPGQPVLVEKLIMKDTYGFVIGKPVELRSELTEEDLFTFLDDNKYGAEMGILKSREYPKPIIVATEPFSYDLIAYTMDQEVMNIYTPDLGYIWNRYSPFEEFVNKYFISRGEITGEQSVFHNMGNMYIYGVTQDMVESMKNSPDFKITYIPHHNIKAPSKEFLERHRESNVKKLQSMSDKLKNMAKYFPRESYMALGKYKKRINEALERHGLDK